MKKYSWVPEDLFDLVPWHQRYVSPLRPSRGVNSSCYATVLDLIEKTEKPLRKIITARVDRKLAPVRKEIVAAMSSYFEEQVNRVTKRLASGPPLEQTDLAVAHALPMKAETNLLVVALLDPVRRGMMVGIETGLEDLKHSVRRRKTRLLERTKTRERLEAEIDAELAEFGWKLAIGYPDFSFPEAGWLKKNPIQFSRKYAGLVTETTNGMIREQIVNGIKEGEGVFQIMDRIRQAYAGVSDFRAELIARDQTARAYTAGSMETWNQNDVGEKQSFWNGDKCGHGALGTLCIDIEAMGPVSLDYEFETDDFGPVDGPPYGFNCGCVLAPVIGDTEFLGGE